MCKVLLNEELKGIELYFDGKPDQEIREEMKLNGFRWNGKKVCWYAKQNEKSIKLAEKLSNGEVKEVTPLVKKTNTIDLWSLTQIEDTKKHIIYGNKEIAKEVRSYLKKRFPFVKFSIKSDLNSIDCYIVNSPFEENSKYLKAIQKYCKEYINTYNYNNSDIMTDYFDVNFYGGYFDLSYKYEQTAMTEEIKKAMKNFDIEEKKAKDQERAEQEKRYQEYLKQVELDKIEADKRMKKEDEEKKYIYDNVEVVEVTEENKYFVVDAHFANLNKNNTLDQYKEEVSKGDYYNNTLTVTRELHFKNKESLNYFSNMLLHDFTFIEGTGGSYTDDLRVNNMIDYNNMTQEEKNTVEWLLKGIAVYLDNEIQFVIDAQGYSYSRYVGLIGDNTKIEKSFKYTQVVDVEKIEKLKVIAEQVNSLVNDTIEGETSDQTRKNIVKAIKSNNIKLNKNIVQQIKNETNKNKLYNCLNKCDTIQDQVLEADIISGEKITIVNPSMLAGASITQCKYSNSIKESILNNHENILVYKGWLSIPESVLYITTNNGRFSSKSTKYGSYDSKATEDILMYLGDKGYRPIINTYKPLF